MQIGNRIGRLLVAVVMVYIGLVSLAAAQIGSGDAVTTANVNMRQGPGTNYAVVAVLREGDRVFVNRCSRNWCLSDFGRDRGWISENFLRPVFSSPGGGRPQPGGPGGPIQPGWPGGIGIGLGRACFFDRDNFRGRSFCLRQGESERSLGQWDNRISSISIEGRFTSAEVCTNRNFSNCSTFTRDAPILNFRLQQNISSIRVR